MTSWRVCKGTPAAQKDLLRAEGHQCTPVRIFWPEPLDQLLLYLLATRTGRVAIEVQPVIFTHPLMHILALVSPTLHHQRQNPGASQRRQQIVRQIACCRCCYASYTVT